jgi:hypothetical protein
MKTLQDRSRRSVRPELSPVGRPRRALPWPAACLLLGGSVAASALAAGCANVGAPSDETSAGQAECTSGECVSADPGGTPLEGDDLIWPSSGVQPGLTSCPDDFSLVGTPGARGAFCITQQQIGPAPYLSAQVDCFSMETSTGDIPYLCTQHEWYVACEIEPNPDQPALANLIDGKEWVADQDGAKTALTLGAGACGAVRSHAIQKELPYRCCIRG